MENALEYYLLLLGIGIVAWIYRTIVEADPDPFLVNMTLYPCVGQLILLVDMLWNLEFLKINNWPAIVILSIATLTVMAIQVHVFRKQVWMTKAHYKKLLGNNQNASLKINGTSDISKEDQFNYMVDRWAEAASTIAGVDFYPEFYENLSKFLGGNRREERRELAHWVLPNNIFKKTGTGGITTDSLKVPSANRKWPWRLHAILCGSAWGLLLISVLLVK